MVEKRKLLWKAVENMNLKSLVKVIATVMRDQILFIVAQIQRDQPSKQGQSEIEERRVN